MITPLLPCTLLVIKIADLAIMNEQKEGEANQKKYLVSGIPTDPLFFKKGKKKKKKKRVWFSDG